MVFTLLPLQSCTNTLIGEKLESNFDSIDNPINSVRTDNKPQKINQKTKIESRIQEDMKDNENDLVNSIKENSISNRSRFNQKSIKSTNKTIFNPQPYRVIIKLSGANPAAPAESVTEALRKAGVEFEVEKIERFYDEDFSKATSLKR